MQRSMEATRIANLNYELLKKLTTKQEKVGKEEMQSDDTWQTEASRHFIDLTSSDTNNLHDFDEAFNVES